MSAVENLSRPGQQPADGDLILVKHGNGAQEKRLFFVPKDFPAPAPGKEAGDATTLLANKNWSAQEQSDAVRLLLRKAFP